MLAAVPTPRVRLPTQASLNPNLSILIGMVEAIIASHGPAAAARTCADLSSQMRRAALHQSVAGALCGPFVIGHDCLLTAADWFLDASMACARCQQ